MKTVQDETALRHHLETNFMPPYSENAVTKILGVCEDFNAGKVTLGTLLYDKTTVVDLLKDLNIEIEY